MLYCLHDGLRLYADRCVERNELLKQALAKLIAVFAAEPEVREAFVFGSYAAGRVGPTSDLDILVVRDTKLGIVDRVADLKFAARSAVGLDLIVVTPEEYRSTFSASSFGRTVLAQARRVYAARSFRRRGHIGGLLMAEFTGLGYDVPTDVEIAANRLDLFYMGSRYPDALGGADPSKVLQTSDAIVAIDQARSVFVFAGNLV